MKAVRAWRTAYESDPGLERGVNEDRVLVDEERGILLVVDGLGGHAAGEMAAETAVRVIDQKLSRLDNADDLEALIAAAITEANNQIFDLAESNENWRGMACVLTLAVVQNEHVTVGHVGDTRLYLAWNGTLRKITSDHSPVGEREDQGLLSEEAAMRHPRRNEVFRDVGSRFRERDESNFIELRKLPFRQDAALLLCSDGLSDVITAGEISEVIDRYDGNPESVAHQLVEAANRAGGHDNVSVVFLAGPDFIGMRSSTLEAVRTRHATTRPKRRVLPSGMWIHALTLLGGILLGMSFWAILERLVPAPPAKNVSVTPKHTVVNPADPLSLAKAVNSAGAGDAIEIPPGNYLGPIQLKDGITLTATAPNQVFVRSDVVQSPDMGIGLVARGVNNARVRGINITGDPAHPLRVGVVLANSSVELDDVTVSGASEAGIRVSGSSGGILLGNYVHDNAGPGIVILDTSSPRLIGNRISANGRLPESPSAGLEIQPGAAPVLENNIVTQNGLATLGAISPAAEETIRSRNFVDPVIAVAARQKTALAGSRP